MVTNNRLLRQSGLINKKILSTPIRVIGAGGIGSFTVLTLAKMGFDNISVWDFDTIEEHNLSNQFYRTQDMGQKKVKALTSIVKDFCEVNIKPSEIEFDSSMIDQLEGIIIPAVDNMRTRKFIFRSIRRKPEIIGLVDGRMGGNQAEVYTVHMQNNEQKKIYNGTLWSDSEADEIPCTERAVMYNVLWIASTIANNVRLMLSEEEYKPINIMDLQNTVLHQPTHR